MRRLIAAGIAGAVLGGPVSAEEATTTTSAEPAAVVRPMWTRRPDRAQVLAVYPRTARGEVGEAIVRCKITSEGRLDPCEVVQANGSGFGPAVLKLARLFQMQPVDADGEPVAGRTIRVPMRLYPRR